MDTKRRSWTVGLLLAGLLALGLTACSDDDGATATTTTGTTSTETETSSTQAATTASSTTAPSTSGTSTTGLSSTTAESSTTASTAGSSTEAPSITIGYRCGDGEMETTDIPTDDIEEIDDIVNTIDLCEFQGALMEISFTAPCPSGDREVIIPIDDGEVPDIATLDLCENP